MKRVVLFMAFCFLSVGLVGQIMKEEDKFNFDLATQKYRAGEYKVAVNLCSEVLNKGPNRKVFFLRAKAYLELEKYQQAMFDLKKASEYGNDNAMIYYLMGNVNMKLKKFTDAEIEFIRAQNDFNKKVKDEEKFFPFLMAMGNAQRYNGTYKVASMNLEKATKYGPKSAWVDLASSHLQYGNMRELKNVVDTMNSLSILSTSDTILRSYVRALNHIVYDQKDKNDITELSYAIVKNRSSSKAFNGFKYDLIYAKYNVLLLNGYDSLAYLNLKEYCKELPSNHVANSNLSELKTRLGIDATPPLITILNPELDHLNSAAHRDSRDKITVYGKIEDDSPIKALKIENELYYGGIEQDGIFVTTLELHKGDNSFIIEAEDAENNVAQLEFFIHFEEEFERRIKEENFSGFNINEIPDFNDEVTNHAIFIAEKDYVDQRFPDLANPIIDADELKDILVSQYEFEEENVTTLYNSTKSQILDTISDMCRKFTNSDNLFVFYAGHGDAKKVDGKIQGGYIIPVDASKTDRKTYISSNELQMTIGNTKAKHILLLVDACFSGSLMRSVGSDAPQYIKDYNNYVCRKIISSGNLEEVPDQSEFIQNVKDFLLKNNEEYPTADDLHKYILKNTKNSNIPQFGQIKNTGDDGGMFIFFRRK
ncbi:MAG: caspase family protein [Schleiferiaceae bacterium]|jgi:tetratricopeptide (TPR) repeat protein|nr:caspase family protein [Schleiferiaceae bacterium]